MDHKTSQLPIIY